MKNAELHSHRHALLDMWTHGASMPVQYIMQRNAVSAWVLKPIRSALVTLAAVVQGQEASALPTYCKSRLHGCTRSEAGAEGTPALLVVPRPCWIWPWPLP